MQRPSVQKNIHIEAFNKVCEAFNKVHDAKQIDWDLCELVVLWAYRTLWKNLTV